MSEQVNGRPLSGAEEIRLQEDERRAKGYYTLEEVAESLRGQLDWSEAQRETFLRESLLPAAQAGRVPVLHPHTLLPYRPEVFRTFYELTTPALVNKWLHSDGLPYRWRELPPTAGPMSPEAEALAEVVCNGGSVDWLALAQYPNLTPMQAAQAAHRIDPLKWWRDPEGYAQGPLPSDLLERIRRLEQLLRGKAAEWSLASLAVVLGEQAPLGMRQVVEAAGPVPTSPDWRLYRVRERLNLYELACLLAGRAPESEFDQAFSDIRDRFGGPDGLGKIGAAGVAEMIANSPEMHLGEPVGRILRELRTAAAGTAQTSLTLARAREVAEALGHPWPPELRRAASLSEVVGGWPEVELRIERAHARIDEYRRAAQRIRGTLHEPGKEPREVERAARFDAKAAELGRRLADENDELDDFASPELSEASGSRDEPASDATVAPPDAGQALRKWNAELLAKRERWESDARRLLGITDPPPGLSDEPEAKPATVTPKAGDDAPGGVGGPVPLTTRDIAEALDGIESRDADGWAALLGDATRKAKWATPARVEVGARRGTPARWNPLELAKILIGRDVKRERIDRAFREREALAEWRGEWKREQAAFRELERYFRGD